MAEAILSQISGDFLECTICLEPFKDPKILPCLHTFCTDCLEKFVVKQGDGKDRFPCPTCRTETVLPGGGVAGLKNNFFVLSLRDTVDTHKTLVSKEDDKVPCDNCEVHVASHGCVVCEEFLCDECARVHRRAKRTRDHDVIGVAELKKLLLTKPPSVKSTSLPMCPKHEDEKLKFYCETCKHPICRDCTVLQHKDHGYSYMADVVSDVRARIKGKLESAKPKVEEYRQFAGIVTKKQEELDTMSKKASDDIDEAAEEEIKYYNDLIRRKQTELKEKLAAVTAARSKQLSATADSVESTLGCLSSTVDFSQKVVKHGSDFDVMNVYSDVTARLESLLKGPNPDIPDDIGYVRFDPRKKRKVPEIILGDIVEEKDKTVAVEVTGFTGDEFKEKREVLRFYFENTKRSGGGEISQFDIDSEKDRVLIVFEDKEAPRRVMQKSHQIGKRKLNVRIVRSRTVDPTRILLKGVAESVTEETLFIFLEARCRGQPSEIFYGKEVGTVMVAFTEPISDLDSLLAMCDGKKLHQQRITAEKVYDTDSIQVT